MQLNCLNYKTQLKTSLSINLPEKNYKFYKTKNFYHKNVYNKNKPNYFNFKKIF